MQIGFSPQMAVASPRTQGAAGQLESAFLTEILKMVMPDSSGALGGGGIGEAQFSSFLTERYAASLSPRLDLGLAARLRGTDA